LNVTKELADKLEIGQYNMYDENRKKKIKSKRVGSSLFFNRYFDNTNYNKIHI